MDSIQGPNRGERRRRNLDFKAHYDCAEWSNIIAEEIVIADSDFKHTRGGEDRTMTAYCYVSIQWPPYSHSVFPGSGAAAALRKTKAGNLGQSSSRTKTIRITNEEE